MEIKSSWLCLLCLLATAAFSQNQAPQIHINQASLNGNLLTVNYSLTDPDNNSIEVFARLSDNNGANFLITPISISGDAGAGIAPGSNKSISIDLSAQVINPELLEVKLVADDHENVDIQEIVDQVSKERLQSDLAFIAGIRHRTAGAAHLQATRDSIFQWFSNFGLQVSVQPFPYGSFTGQNISGKLPGNSDEAKVWLNDAHYDSVANGPGADDNGTGIAGVIEAARILSNYQFEHSIRFTGFDLEETGLTGSTYFVSNGGIPANEQLQGVLNYEMIGYYSDVANSQQLPTGFNLLFPDAYNQVVGDSSRGNFITNVANTASIPLMTAFNDAAAQYVPDLRVISVATPNNGQITPDLQRSDHTPFWIAGYQALMLTDGANFRNLNYHTAGDTYSTINFDFMTNVVKATVATIAGNAKVRHSSSDVWDILAGTHELNCNIVVAPNPAHQTIQVRFNDCPRDHLLISLSDSEGKTITQTMLPASASEWNYPANGLTPGIYYLKLSRGNESKTKKIMIE